jgi:hypothetical protein
MRKICPFVRSIRAKIQATMLNSKRSDILDRIGDAFRGRAYRELARITDSDRPRSPILATLGIACPADSSSRPKHQAQPAAAHGSSKISAQASVDWLEEHPNRSSLRDRMDRVHCDLRPLTSFYFGYSRPALTLCSLPTRRASAIRELSGTRQQRTIT